MILIVDNFDSFTFNLVQVLQHVGGAPEVLRNDNPHILDLARSGRLTGAVISPGPGHPRNTGLCRQFLETLPRDLPVLGVCLGHQLLGWLDDSEVGRAGRVMHGKTSEVVHDNTDIFAGLPNPFTVCRYHSLLVDPATGRGSYAVTARTDQNEVMGLAYRDRPWYGVQFHPESILTPDGPLLLKNFLDLCA